MTVQLEDQSSNTTTGIEAETPQYEQFSAQFLKSMSPRMWQTFSNSQLFNFLSGRFAFFQEAVRRNGMVRVQPIQQTTESINGLHSNGHVMVDIASPDAPFSVVTVEALMRNLDLRIYRKLHPMMGVSYSADREIQSIFSPLKADVTYDYICLEIEADADQDVLKRLETRIALHMLVVQLVHVHHQDMVVRLEAIKQNIKSGSNAVLVSEISEVDRQEWINLADWLINDHFEIFGAITFSLENQDSPNLIQVVENSGRGILAPEYLNKAPGKLLEILTVHVWKRSKTDNCFTLDRIRSQSPILRFENLMRLGLRVKDEEHGVVEHVFLGLLKGSSLQAKNSATPLIHRKMKYIYKERQMLDNSYDYNEVVRIFSATPKFELFRSSNEELLKMCDALLSVNNPNQIHCFQIESSVPGITKLVVLMPNILYSEQVVEKIASLLQTKIPHQYCDWFEARGDSKTRVHLEFELNQDTEGNYEQINLDLNQIEIEIGEQINPWENQILDKLRNKHPGIESKHLFERYVPYMPPHYRARINIQEAIEDIKAFELMAHNDGIQFNLKPFNYDSLLSEKVSLLYVYSRGKIHLNEVLPILQNLGLHIVDQLTTRIGNGEKTIGYIQSFRVNRVDGIEIDQSLYKPLLGAIVKQVFNNNTENDPLNGLALLAQLGWREINILQLYRNLLLQLNAPMTKETLNTALLRHPNCAKILIEAFECRFSIDSSFGVLEYRRDVLLPQKKKELLSSLEQVRKVVDDTVFRRLFELIENTLRTNFYIPKTEDNTAISIKLESRKIEQMPIPVPYREIYVHDVGMEGVHLRFGPVARGGLRWSDRPDDFRTEVLGLVKTQQTKNVVIVPVGSKGGFVVKKTSANREAALIESQKQYRRFISALLDITDNMDAQGGIHTPNSVIPYDQQDPYLVVAADKGTATFSDIANSISEKYDFWLGDAFASGGSVGYDHKKEGITARGGWECVKLHFKELGQDVQSEATTVIGVGDMSGDVFGNGLLQSKALLLQAAFNHMHIFLDPDPDPLSSWDERSRLFALPRSTWTDYSTAFISAGGGIYERNTKKIVLSPEVKSMLNTDAEFLNGDQLVRLILQMNADLLWFGGIGTYIKTSTQTNFQAGDPANNEVRIDSNECHAKVIGEGANLGMTQKARIDMAIHGIRLNTDAIDNSAGVNMSDYEVNLKILLQQLKRNGLVKTMEERNELFAAATDEVSELVLANNRGQHRLISMDSLRSLRNFRLFRRLIAHLQSIGLNKRSEFIPSRAELDQLEHANLPVPRPVLSVLLAYAKMEVYDELTASEFPLVDELTPVYKGYLPEFIKNHFGDDVNNHPLKKEIVSTVLTNKIVNQTGSVFISRMVQLTEMSIPEIVRAYLVMDASLGAGPLREYLLSIDNITEVDRYEALIDLEDVLEMLTRSVLQNSDTIPGFNHIEKFRELLTEMMEHPLIEVLAADSKQEQEETGNDIKSMESEESENDIESDPFSLDAIRSSLRSLRVAPDVLHLCVHKGLNVEAALRIAEFVEQQFGFDWLSGRLGNLEPQNDWELEHQDILVRNLELHKRNILKVLLSAHKPEELETLDFEGLLQPLETCCAGPLRSYAKSIDQLRAGAIVSLASISVTLSRLDYFKSISLANNN